MRPAAESVILDPGADAVDALSALRTRDEHRAVIVLNGRPVGIVSLRDLL
jgi:CBS domain-containing protein